VRARKQISATSGGPLPEKSLSFWKQGFKALMIRAHQVNPCANPNMAFGITA
jgi:hypothetical protein